MEVVGALVMRVVGVGVLGSISLASRSRRRLIWSSRAVLLFDLLMSEDRRVRRSKRLTRAAVTQNQQKQEQQKQEQQKQEQQQGLAQPYLRLSQSAV